MTRLGDARNYIRRHSRNPDVVTAINVDGLRSRPGEETIRPMFQILDDRADVRWHYHHDVQVDEREWLDNGCIVDAVTGNLHHDDGALMMPHYRPPQGTPGKDRP